MATATFRVDWKVFSRDALRLDLTAAKNKRRPGEAAAEKVDIDLANVEKANLVPEI